MKEQLFNFIRDKSFPCIMAKSVLSKGHIAFNEVKNIEDEESIIEIQNRLYKFIEQYRSAPKKLSSFIVCIDNDEYNSFEKFETFFWKFLHKLNVKDKLVYEHDKRVSSDPQSSTFSFSMKSEAFFILALHPESPRLARKFKYPTIVFNPHQQFEDLRSKGLFKKIRDLIRKKDELLQGYINPMLEDFGNNSEVFQYLGKKYELNSPCPLLQ